MKHVTYEIVQDDYPSNPRDEFDHISTFYGPKNSRWTIGGKKDIELDDLEGTIKDFRREKAIIVEFESNAGTCYAIVERDQLHKEYLQYGYSMRKALYRARQCAKGEITEWLAYANGEVYGWIVKDNDGNTLDSVWGYYGYEFAEQEAKENAEYHEQEIEKELQAVDDRLVQVSNP
jgi:hypothetical protein